MLGKVTSWYGLFVPAGTPQSIVDKVYRAVRTAQCVPRSAYRAVRTVLDTPAMEARLKALGAERVDSSPESFKASLPGELAHWKQVVDAAGARID